MGLEKRFYELGIIPVVAFSDIEEVVPTAQALINGGLPAIEVTFRTDIAAGAIHLIKQMFPKMLVGAGTLLSIDQVEQAIKVGADFFVAPGFNADLITQAWEYDLMFIPGCATASEVDEALRMNIKFVKFFPAEACNARKYISALNGPYPQMNYMPTGGISLENMAEYLEIDNVVCCGGSWIASSSLMQSGNFEQVRENAKQVAEKVKSIRGNN